MKQAPPTEDEVERLKALYDYDVLDTEAEKVFDDLTQLAAQICGMPITLISLVDPDRQWFKSKVGLDAKETSRDIAFCAHAIHQKHIFEVEDTLKDERFFDNPLVTSPPSIRFYAGTPLITPGGHAIGTLCVIDGKPNKLTTEQRLSLEVLGRSVISQMELRKHIKQLELANQHKTEFLSNMSHELRTPLNAIIGFSRLMLDDVKTHNLPEKFSQYLSHIDFSGNKLLNVINSVIDLNKIEAGQMQEKIEPIQIAEFLIGLHGMLSILADEKGIALSFDLADDLPAFLAIDHAKVSQIITNLVHNAVKFTDKNKSVQAKFSWQQDKLSISVSDQGVGISNADQAKLFTKFQQVGNRKNVEGSGLGLAICKSLVNLLKGEISVQSTLGQGSVFNVSLPASALDEQSTHDSEQPVEQKFNKNSSVLLVEDNEINQMVMTAIFDAFGMQISLAKSGEEAVDIALSQPVDLILMDIHLPNMNGKEAAQIIKQQKPSLPIVALTADAITQANGSGTNHLWQDYLAKPLDKSLLLKVLNRFIPQTEPS
ncbi:ATP-binding protein [Paraglaciecola aestuariivivens]